MNVNDLPLFRATDPVTSRKGARDVKVRQGSYQHLLLAAYAHPAWSKGMTDYEAGHATGLLNLPNCGYWKRCSELRAKGLIADTGTTRPGISGSEQMVCAITDAGLDVLGKVRMDNARNA